MRAESRSQPRDRIVPFNWNGTETAAHHLQGITFYEWFWGQTVQRQERRRAPPTETT